MTPVTNADIWSEVIGMRAEMRTLFTEIAVIKARNTGSDQMHADHESRLRKIENGLIQVKAFAAAIATLTGTISGIITALIAHVH